MKTLPSAFLKGGHSPFDIKLKKGALLLANLVIALTYLVAARMGFTLSLATQQINVVWPSTGIAFAAALLFGKRILPGIALGAFFASFANNEPLISIFGVTIANTLEAWVAVITMRRLAGFNVSLGRLRDVISLILFAGVCSTMLGANIGVMSLCLGGVQSWANYRPLWLLWWLGDATGALIVTPAVLAWAALARQQPLRFAARMELLALLTGLTGCCFTIFATTPEASIRSHLFIYAIFSFVIWGALRFGQRGTTLVTLISSGLAIWFDMHGMGPFSSISMDRDLIHLLIFMGVVSATSLFLGAAIMESNVAAEALKIADRRKNEFLATLAHELRSPLAPIGNALHLLDLPGLTPDKAVEARSIMRRQLQQVNRLVDDLLDVARITHGKMELRPRPIQLLEVIKGALDAVKPVMQNSNHRLSVRLPPPEAWLYADAVRLSQIFTNLLNNSAKYTPSGGEIALDCTLKAGKVTIHIRDNGIGIPPSLLPRIFDLYMQVDYSSEHSQGGLGIGLTLVKKLVEIQGGEVRAYSAGSFKGSEFTVSLPLISPPPNVVKVPPGNGKIVDIS